MKHHLNGVREPTPMARAHRSDLLPHIHALIALVEHANAPELLFREIVELLVHETPIIVEAHVVRSADHAEGVRRLAEALMGHVQAGRASQVAGMRRTVLEAAEGYLRELEEYVRLERWVEEIEGKSSPRHPWCSVACPAA